MVAFVLTHSPWEAISNLELQQSFKALRDDLVLPSTTTLSNIWLGGYALAADAIEKQLPPRNKVSLALDGLTSTNKLVITSVTVHYMDRKWALCEVQLAFNEDDRLFSSRSNSYRTMIWQGPTYGRKDSCTYDGCAGSFGAHRRPFAGYYHK